jgi:hypothetical protein
MLQVRLEEDEDAADGSVDAAEAVIISANEAEAEPAGAPGGNNE